MMPMPTVSRWTMRIDDHRYGFLFGTGLQAAFLEEYYAGSEPSPAKAAWVLIRAIFSAMVQGPLVKKLFAEQPMDAIVDGTRWPRDAWMSVAAGTVDDIGLGFRPYYKAPTHPGNLHAVGFACSGFTVVRELPRIWRAQPTRSPDILDDVAKELILRSPLPIGYMIDGDFHRGGQEVVVRVGPRVDFVATRA